jgi:hypothetical protein
MHRQQLSRLAAAAATLCLTICLGGFIFLSVNHCRILAISNNQKESVALPATLVPDYRRYVSAIKDQVVSRCDMPRNAGTTVVSFKVYRDGEVSELEFADGPGQTKGDQLALQAVGAVAPFNPMPEDCPDTIRVCFPIGQTQVSTAAGIADAAI